VAPLSFSSAASSAADLFPQHGGEWQLLCSNAAQVAEFAAVLARCSRTP